MASIGEHALAVPWSSLQVTGPVRKSRGFTMNRPVVDVVRFGGACARWKVGPTVSTVHCHAAGDAVRVPSGWTARTSKRLVPSDRAEYGFGLVQGAKDGADAILEPGPALEVAPG